MQLTGIWKSEVSHHINKKHCLFIDLTVIFSALQTLLRASRGSYKHGTHLQVVELLF